jgi:glycosyltransferase involved in cell wall biosynthesis
MNQPAQAANAPAHFTVTICIPTYNRPALLEEALRSCMAQTCPPDEIVIGDDSRDDLSRQLVSRLRAETDIPIAYQHNIPSLGQNANMNDLFQRASGSHIVLLHDDDLLQPDAVKDLLGCWALHPDLTGAFGKQIIISSDGQEIPQRSEALNRTYRRTSELAGLQPRSWEVGLSQQFPNCGWMLLGSVARATPWKPASEVGNGGEFDFGVRLGLTGGKFYFVDKYTCKYRLNSQGSMSSSLKDDAALQAYKLTESLPLPPEAEPCRRNALRRSAPVAMGQALNLGDKRTAWRIYSSPNHPWRLRLQPGGVKRLIRLAIPNLKTSA